MTISPVQRLPGMRDFAAQAYRRLRDGTERVTSFLADNGYEMIETPLLEEAELFVRKSGGELTSRLYTFVDPGGHRVSLRPEFTSSIIRCFIQQGRAAALPIRWQYSGPVFRYERGTQAGFRQFTQAGAELIGSGGPEADAEVMALAWNVLEKTGLRGCRMRVGHLGVIQDLLAAYGLSEPARQFIISNISSLRKGGTDVASLVQQANGVGLLRTGLQIGPSGGTEIAGTDGTREFVKSVLSEAMSSPLGRRSADEIAERLLRKTRNADDPTKLEDALELASELAHLEGGPGESLERGVGITQAHGLPGSPFDELGKLFDALSQRGVHESNVILDLGLVGGIAYYTGVIFELAQTSGTEEAPLGSGGRYDGLVKALGGPNVPAIGFAFNMNQVTDATVTANSAGPKPARKPAT